jgi:hypothetical protein
MVYKVTINNKSAMAEGRFQLHYGVGDIVSAIPGSMGIMCFESIKDSKGYI